MSTNKYKAHILVLPEDDANRQIANGFVLHPNLNERAIQILPAAGGWTKIMHAFRTVHAHQMKQYHERRIVLIREVIGFKPRTSLPLTEMQRVLL